MLYLLVRENQQTDTGQLFLLHKIYDDKTIALALR